MHVVVVSGIYPPDIGGPAIHAAAIRESFVRRGHQVTVLSLIDAENPEHLQDVVRFPRSWPVLRRLAAVSIWLIRNRARYDVVYATGLQEAAVLGARLARRRVVVKVVGDPAWERSRRLGLTDHEFIPFQEKRFGLSRIAAMKWARSWAVRHASAVTVPSEFLQSVVDGWARGRREVRVIRNGVRIPDQAPRLRDANRHGELRLIFVGRLVGHKNVEALIDAVSLTPKVRLTVIGEGPDFDALVERVRAQGVDDRVEFLGALPHQEALTRLSESDALVLASAYEGLPHVVIEALARGVTVVTSPQPGTLEAIKHQGNGWVVDTTTPAEFAAVFERLQQEPDLLETLREQAWESAQDWSIDRSLDDLEGLLANERGSQCRPVTILFGKSVYPQPLPPDLSKKLEILVESLSPYVVGVGNGWSRWQERGAWIRTFPRLKPGFLGGLLFYLAGPFVVLWLVIRKRGQAVICQSPYEALGVLALRKVFPKSRRPLVIVEVHGDWRTATRFYGSPMRRLLIPLSDRLAEVALRRADRVRSVGRFTEDLVRSAGYDGEIDVFPTYSDFEFFLRDPPRSVPTEPVVAYVGGLERTKGADLLLSAWEAVAQQHPDARLIVAGTGPLTARFERAASSGSARGSISLLGQVSRSEVREVIDSSRFLVLPSRSEGLPRVILEAFARGRAVVGTRVGGIPELVADEKTGLLVEPDSAAIATAINSCLATDDETRAMGSSAHEWILNNDPREQFRDGMKRVAGWIRKTSVF